MGPLIVVELEVSDQFPAGLRGVGAGFQLHLLVLHRAPRPLYQDVAAVDPFSIHADVDPVFLPRPDELPAGELAAPSLRWGRL